MNNDIYSKRKALGICVRCGECSARPDRTMCIECAEKHRKITRKMDRKRKENGLCVWCGKYPVDPGHSTCLQCRENYNKQRQKRIQEWREQGLCIRCGKTADPGYKTCQNCRQTGTRRAVEKYQERKKQGLCPKCGGETTDSHILCPDCRKKMQRDRYPHFDLVMERDSHQCQLCSATEKLHVHHIDGQGLSAKETNNEPDNLIIICSGCHAAITRLRHCNKDLAVKLITA